MPNTLVITKVGPDAERILDAFQERTKLAARDGETARIFTFEGAGHGVDVGAERHCGPERRFSATQQDATRRVSLQREKQS